MSLGYFSNMRWPGGHGVPQHVINNLQTSTPKVGLPPPLSTPGTTNRHQHSDNNGGGGIQQQVQHALHQGQGSEPVCLNSESEDDRFALSPRSTVNQVPSCDPHEWMPPVQSLDVSNPQFQRGETEGGNDAEANFPEINTAMNMFYNTQDNANQHYNTRPQENGFVDAQIINQYLTNPSAVREDMQGRAAAGLSYPYHNTAPAVYPHENRLPTHGADQFHGYNGSEMPMEYIPMVSGHCQMSNFQMSPTQRLLSKEGSTAQRPDSFENYKVEYTRSKSPTSELEVIGSQKIHSEAEFLAGKDPSFMPRPTTPGGESEDENKIEFFKQGKFVVDVNNYSFKMKVNIGVISEYNGIHKKTFKYVLHGKSNPNIRNILKF